MTAARKRLMRRRRRASKIAARDFGNLDPGDAAHALAFDRHHGVRELADHLALLLGIEHVLDDVNLYQRHVVLLDACLAEARAASTCPRQPAKASRQL